MGRSADALRRAGAGAGATDRSRIAAIFFLQALAGGGIFARIPDIQAGLGLSEATLGAALTCGLAGSLAVNLISARVVGRFGTRAILTWGLPLLAVVNAAIAIAPTYGLLLGALVASGAVFSITNVTMNVEADRVEQALGSPVMNLCHGVWGFGMLAASAIGVGARALPVSPGVHLWTLAPLIALAGVLVMGTMRPAKTGQAAGDAAEQPRGVLALPSLRSLLIVGFGISASIAQMAAQNWSVIFMRDSFTVPDWQDTLTLPGFLVAMSLGRVFADRWIARLGARPVALMLCLLGLSASGVVALTTSPWLAMLGFVALGFGAAVQFPLMITAAARSTTRDAAEAVSAVIFTTGTLMLVTPVLMGWIAELWGLRAAFAALAGPFLLSILLLKPVLR